MAFTSKKRGKKRKSSRKRSSYGRRSSHRVPRTRAVVELHPYTLAQVNPFDRNCYDCRIPDANTAPSSPFFAYDELQMDMSTTNAYCVACIPHCQYYAIAATNNVDPSGWTWPAAFGGLNSQSKASSVTAQYTLARTVAHGIRISCGLSPTTVTGYVHVALYSLSDYGQTTWQYPTTIAQMTELPYYRRFTLAELTQGAVTISNKFNDISSRLYRDTSDTGKPTLTGTLYQWSQGWMSILVAVEGAPSGSRALVIESINHMEGQSKFSGLNQDGPAEPYSGPILDGTADYVARKDPVRKGDNNVSQAEKTGVMNAMQSAITRQWSVFTGQVLHHAVSLGTAAVGVVGYQASRMVNRGYRQARDVLDPFRGTII
nr:coat protein [Cressdnaviricota sp.]